MRDKSMDLSPILISLKTACAAIVFTFILGMAAARLVTGLKNIWLKTLLDALFTLPLVLPPTVMGFFLLYVFGVYRPIGSFFVEFFGIRVPFSWGATVLAAVVIAFPLMYRSARGAIEQVDNDIINAGRTLGMSENAIFFKVVLPNAKPGIISGTVLAFARGLGEFGATSMIAGNIAEKTRTLPLAVYSETAAGNMDKAYDYVLILVIIAFAAVTLLNLAGRDRRKMQRTG